MDQVYQDSIDLHAKYRGKLAVASKVPLQTKEDLSLAYTPGVGQVCREIAANPELGRSYTMKGNSVAIITDGTAVLGLGDLGPIAALPVMEGKAILFKEFADIDAIPLCLSTTDTEEIIRTIKNIAPTFGGINLEDIAAPRCFEIEARLKTELDIPVMHDDQHGTAVVVLAALINSLKLKQIDKTEARIVINGAGAAGIAITKLPLHYGFQNITVCDSKGIIYPDRGDLNSEKQAIATETNLTGLRGTLTEALKKAHVFIGVSQANLLTAEHVQAMATEPVIFALANPVPEIMPNIAKAAGAYIIATGRSDFPNQINNVLAFPGIFRGALDNRVTQITTAMLTQAAENLANHVADVSTENILPNALDKTVAEVVADAVK